MIIWIHLLSLLLNMPFCIAACNNAEYEINEECCPMCDPGKRVKNHCDETTSTTCELCPAKSYTDAPNGFTECLSCSLCDPNNGLREKQECTLKSNTVCGPLSGYYCIDLPCTKAITHSTCSPGQYVNKTGTETTDTVCDKCPAGSYSNVTLCKLHTICESVGKETVEAGTETSDAQCSNGASVLKIVFPSVFGGVLLLSCVVVIVVVIIIRKKKKQSYSITSTDA